MSIPLAQVPEAAGFAWARLRDELVELLGDDLVAMWAYGGTASAPLTAPIGDLDTLVVVRRQVDPTMASSVDGAEAAIAAETGVEWDSWYLVEEDARRAGLYRHAWRDRRNETSAVDRAHLLAGRYVLLHGAEPRDVLLPPTEDEVLEALRAEVEHLERHVEAGDTDPFEATYAFLNGCRIVRALETGDVAISKREAGAWGLEHLPDRWSPALRSAVRAYEHRARREDEDLLAREMAPFVEMVRRRIA